MKPQHARLANEGITLVLVLGILIFAYVLILQFMDVRWDLTTAGQFSLSDSTLKILERVKIQDKSIQVTFFVRPDKSPEESLKRRRIFDLLEQYHYLSGKKIGVPRVLNPDQAPQEVQRLGIRNVGTVVFEFEGGKRQMAAPRDIWTLRLIDGRPGPEEFRGENAFSSALKRLLEGKERRIVFVSGHKENEIGSREPDGLRDLADAFELSNYSTREVSLVQEKKIPADANLVVIAGPRQAYFPAEDDILLEYAKSGGRLLIMADPGQSLGLDRLFQYLGVELGDNMVMEPTRAFQGNVIQPVPLYGSEHPITKDLQGSGENLLLSTARSVERALGDTNGITTTNLLITSTEGWGEVGYQTKPGQKQKEVRFDAKSGDLKGPVTMALSSSRGETRAVVVGDADFSTNKMLKFGSNKDFLLNTAYWLAGEEQDIGISSKDPQFNYITMTNRQVWVVFTMVIVLVPAMVLAGGVFQWLNRRSL